ncbi:MAG: redoxin family protein [Gammaproteobacteria bacterium]
MKPILKISAYMLTGILTLAILVPVQAAALAKGATVPAASFLAAGKPVSVGAYRGHKVILWMFSTWCPTCEASASALAAEQAVLARYGVRVLVLENYKNGGYPGPSIEAFARDHAPDVVHARNWTFGNATRTFAARYNGKGYADIYYLIGADGVIKQVSSAPSATMDTILKFIQS